MLAEPVRPRRVPERPTGRLGPLRLHNWVDDMSEPNDVDDDVLYDHYDAGGLATFGIR